MRSPVAASLLLLGCSSPSTAAAADSGAAMPSPGRDFVCNEVIGLQATGQWYAAGFEGDGVDGSHWQAKTQHQAYIETWADPAHEVWDQPLTSPCASGADNPDRVVFVAFSPPTMTEAQWQKYLVADITNIKARYSAVKEIDVVSMVRAPGNQVCPGNSDTLVMIAPYIDEAIAAAVGQFIGLARVGPKIYAPACDAFVANDTDLVPAGAAAVAR